MKSRVIAFVLVLAVAIGVAWRWMQSDSNTPEKASIAQIPAKAESPKPATAANSPKLPAAPARVEAPVLAAVQSTAETPLPKPADPPVAAGGSNEPHAEARSDLKTAIPEAIRLLEARDYVNLIKEFMPPDAMDNMPPGMTVEQMADELRRDPETPQQLADMLEALHAIEGQTPIMDGKNAVYKLNPPVGDHKDLTFVNVDGLWYIED